MKYNTIFFDLDDTLIDTNLNSIEALSDIYLEFEINNYIYNIDDFISKYQEINKNLWVLYEQGKTDKENLKTQRFYQTLKANMPLKQSDALKINNRFMQLVATKGNIIAESIDILEYLRPNYQLFIVSNGFTEIQQRKMMKANIYHYFDDVILSDHIGKNKPDPAIFKHALSIAQRTSDECIMIGDNINTDIIGAKKSNIDQIWFNPKNDKNDSIFPTYEINKLKQIQDIL